MKRNLKFTRDVLKPLVYANSFEGIDIHVTPIFIDEESDPESLRYIWVYQIRIENQSNDTLKLEQRHWEITDSEGFVQEVDGEGVVGEFPTLKKGDSYEYTSTVYLYTPSGFMDGHYIMRRIETGDTFNVQIPPFSLDSPYGQNMVN